MRWGGRVNRFTRAEPREEWEQEEEGRKGVEKTTEGTLGVEGGGDTETT